MTKEQLEKWQGSVAALLGSRVMALAIVSGELNITVAREHLLSVLQSLRDDAGCRFDMLVDISGVDYPERKERFEVAYHLLSLVRNMRVRVKTHTDESQSVPSAVALFPAAGWYEREAYDLFGILFSGNPDLRRLLTDYGFEGHPLRKDFPLTGYVEVRYDDEHKRVVYEPVKLTQDFRNFDYLSPWEGMTVVQLPGDEKGSQPLVGTKGAKAER